MERAKRRAGRCDIVPVAIVGLRELRAVFVGEDV